MTPPTATETISSITTRAPESSQTAGAENAKVKMQMPAMPVFEDKMEERQYLKGRLAAAFRIFGKYGYDEGLQRRYVHAVGYSFHARRRWPYHSSRPRGPNHFLGQSIRDRVFADESLGFDPGRS